jgi:hypothetical protein
VRQFTNDNNQAAQITSVWDGFGGVGSLNGNTALNTSATDTSANFNFVFNGQLSVSGDTLKLQRYLVELIAG